MSQFTPGQRWISDAELSLGLGTVLEVEDRMVTVLFPASDETRRYARQTAPLTRVNFVAGDSIRNHLGQTISVTRVEEADGLLSYFGETADGETVEVPEELLDHSIQMNKPSERLFSHQIDPDKWFELRYRTLQIMNHLTRSDLRGLTGCRTSLIPHQLYIAHEVASRFAPRVLLADEVGLGKTIEAGLILHQQLLTERARRVLIVVPETLLHQWLVEMLRRFNLGFSVFDEERCLALEEDNPGENPFHAEQLILCDLDFLVSHPQRVEQALEGDWDLLVVDEAHHLQWSESGSSQEYRIVDALAASTRGVLLLTATPEQLGKASHFARLRLLDPDRFPDFEQFVEEEASYEPVADVVERLLSDEALTAQDLALLGKTLNEGEDSELLSALDKPADADDSSARVELVDHLLDRHGTGRVLFRNTRSAVKGFPGRELHATALPCPPAYADLSQYAVADAASLLSPERLYSDMGEATKRWTQIDPRVEWLSTQLSDLKQQKVLVIAAHAATALELAAWLKRSQGLHAAVFHEGMSIVERDRAAAYFADHEKGTQVLICSEIGSEGRNFQFAHHLILFDLPLNPDLLEQRIGRLDRIGQTQTIRIHVPYIENTAQACLFRWYHEGLDAFRQTCPAGHSVFVQVRDMLLDTLHQPQDSSDDLIEVTKRLHDELNEALHKGRDRLLEYNSCRPRVAQALHERAGQTDSSTALAAFMDGMFDCFGVHAEEHGEHCFIVRPSEHMLTPFPGIPDDGLTITYHRPTALSQEDVQFISWDHPMVNTAIDMLFSSELGNTALTAVKYAGAKAGTLLLECIFLLDTAARRDLQLGRYLPPTSVRVVIDDRGQFHQDKLSHAHIRQHRQVVDRETATQVITAKADELRDLLDAAHRAAETFTPAMTKRARQESEQALGREIARLRALQQVNPNVRDEEIDYFEERQQALTEALASASLRLDAMRVIVAV